MTSQYLNLRIGAARRLSVLRLAADTWNAKHPYAPLQNPTWRQMRFGKLSEPRGLSQGFNVETPTAWGQTTEVRTPIWITQDGPAFERETWADECGLRSIDHKGWYTDREDMDATYRGLVVRLPHGRFITGYYSSDNGERVYFAERYDSKEEAARGADHAAQTWAEREADYQERYRAAQALQERIEETQLRLCECLALRNDPRPCFTRMRDEARECIATIRKAMEELATEYKDVSL